jgi:hypothetical protein
VQTPSIDLVRHIALAPEFRTADAGDDESLGLLTGMFTTFGDWYEVDSVWEGKFMERVASGATEATIRDDRAGMRVLFDHGFDPSIGNKVLGPIDVLEEKSNGAYYEVPLLDTSYNRDLLPGLRKGLYGASFRMKVLADQWDDEPKPSRSNPKGIPERTITRVWVGEFGPVTFPANANASANVRSATDQYYTQLRSRDADAFDAAVRAAGRVPSDITGRPDARSVGGGESDPPHQGSGSTSSFDDPSMRHSVLKALGVIK